MLFRTFSYTTIGILFVNVILSILGIWNTELEGITLAQDLQRIGIPLVISELIYTIGVVHRGKTLWYFGHGILFANYAYFSTKTATSAIDQMTEAVLNIHNKENQEPVILSYGLETAEDSLNRVKIELKDIEIKASESKRRQNEIVMFLAHDLKTPLTSVRAYLTMLDTQENISEEERRKYTSTALEKSIRLGELINEFFEITKYNMQNIQLEKEIFDVSMMLEQIADEFYGVMSEKGLHCKVEAEEGLYINGDTDKLARVFENILRNAVNYCRDNSQVRIRVNDIGDYIEIVIMNEGDQIPGEKLFTIFEKFYRLDDARSSLTGGSGLGLAISKEIIELHEGIIFAESDPEETRFIIRIPKFEE